MALYEVCEIVQLVNSEKGTRAAAIQIQAELMRLSKTKHNLLPHEGKSMVDKKEMSPLIPRIDAL